MRLGGVAVFDVLRWKCGVCWDVYMEDNLGFCARVLLGYCYIHHSYLFEVT
jgi:hypothetical protein